MSRAEDVSFLEIVSGAVPRGWIVTSPGAGPWLGARPRGARVPRKGWKLHVSATVGSAIDVLSRALPVLVGEGVPFKVAVSPAALAALNEGEAGISQIGKFLTVYPADDEQAVRVAAALDEATRGSRGPRVISDHELGPGSLVHYRYGRFTGPSGAPEPPEPALDPFVAAGVAAERRRPALAGRYVPVTMMRRSAGGTVHLALDMETGNRCVLKRAERDARVGPDGRDARDHLRHEASVLERLAPDPRFPAVLELVEDGGDLVLVMEHVEGRPLGSLSSGPWSVPEIVVLARAVASALDRVHRTGLAYRDLNPGNVLVAGQAEVRLVDLELACELGTVGEAAGTPGYASPDQLAGRPAAVGDDVHALGGLLFFLATGADPGTPDAEVRDARLSRIVARCLHDDPGARYGSMDEITAALEEPEAP